MAKTAASKNVDTKVVFASFTALAVGLSMASVLMPPSFSGVINGPWGMFQNLTVIFFLLASALSVKTAWAQRKRGEKIWSPWAILALLALILAGEEVGWLIPFFYDDYRTWPFATLQGLFIQGYEGVPEGVSLKVVALIAGVRLGAILAIIYGILAVYYYRKELQVLPGKISSSSVLYALGFVVLLIVALLMHAGIVPGRTMFEECLEMLSAAALVMSVSGKTY